MKLRLSQPLFLLLSSLMLGAIACSAPTTTTDPEAGVLNLYSSRHYDSDEELYQAFTEATGIQINLIEGKEEELIERIKSEGVNSPADLLMTVDVGNLWRAQEAGILQSIESDVLTEKIPANLRDDENQWFALTKRARVIIYNPDKVQESDLSTYEALAEPQWQGRICMRSSSNIYNQSLVAAKIAKLGEAETKAWLDGLVANFARPPEGNDTAQIQAVAAGACDLAIANTYYVGRLMRSEDTADQEVASKIRVFFPNQDQDGAHINISGAGVTTHAPNQENAIAFLEFLVSAEAQEIFASANNEYPVVENVPANEVVQTLGQFKASDLKVEQYGELNPKAVQLMDQAGWK
ncbi:MAG: Fe(3+) ABC transporter substrate-binding protein [Spirulina sp. DLM2.Bin59]|nr:MAG: Fe(3+) ABC transporter substrate-binding protein [Spirulina sp. DLM2.Bin59]